MKAKQTGGLFYKAVLALSFVSIVPIVLIGWHVLNMNNRVLQSEILDKQRTMANRIAFLISEDVSRQSQFISIFSDLHSVLADHLLSIDQEDLDYLTLKNADIAHLAVLNENGKILFSSGEEATHFNYLAKLTPILQTCFQQKKEYIGEVTRYQDHLYRLMAYPLYSARKQKISEVLVAEIDLKGLEKSLEKNYTDSMQVAVLSVEGQLISSSEKTDTLSEQEEHSLQAQLQLMQQALGDHASARMDIGQKTDVLVSQTQVPNLNWSVLVYQPDHTIRTLLQESFLNSVWNVLFILLAVGIFVVGVAYWILRPIVRPVQRLQEVAVRFEQEDDYLPQEKDLIIPNNEIGQLARIFLQMALVLFERKNALLAAQQELTAMNKQLEARVEERTAELHAASSELVKAERLAAIGQMASIISHEIRNPLAVISNATRLIKVIQPPTDPKLMKQFSIIEAEIKQANGIIGEVLGFARSRDMILSMIDLNSYLHDLVLSFPTPANIRIDMQLDEESVRLKVDSEELKQALRNILRNACEAMPEGGHITVGSQVGKQAVCIFIADEGPGISAELKEKIFSPFFTTKARGTGLGLAVVRKAITRHKGKLFVHNIPDKGAIFEIYLKIYRKLGDTRYG